MTTVIITGVGGPAGRSLVRQFRALERRGDVQHILVGTDMTDVEVDGLTMMNRVPPAGAPGFLPALTALAGFVRADLLIPTVSEELPLVAVAAPLIGAQPGSMAAMDAACGSDGTVSENPHTAVVVSAPEAVALAADKMLTMWALEDAGVAVPQFASAAELSSTAEALRRFGGPVIVKPRVSRGGREVTLLTDAAASAPAWAREQRLIVQSFAPGPEFCAQVYRSPHTQRVEAVVVLAKTRLANGQVGNAVEVVREDHRRDVAELGAAAVQALGVEGPADVDIRIDATGRPVVLEVNARFGAQSAHAPEILDAVLDDYLADDSLAA